MSAPNATLRESGYQSAPQTSSCRPLSAVFQKDPLTVGVVLPTPGQQAALDIHRDLDVGAERLQRVPKLLLRQLGLQDMNLHLDDLVSLRNSEQPLLGGLPRFLLLGGQGGVVDPASPVGRELSDRSPLRLI